MSRYEDAVLSNAEIEAVLSVLWHTYAIRYTYEDRALREDERMWKNNGGLFTNYARYHSKKWKEMMGSDDPSVRGRKISRASMMQARKDFENHYREPVGFALELASRISAAVAKSAKKNGPSECGDREEEIGMRAWKKIAAEPAVREKLAEFASEWCNADASTIQP